MPPARRCPLPCLSKTSKALLMLRSSASRMCPARSFFHLFLSLVTPSPGLSRRPCASSWASHHQRQRPPPLPHPLAPRPPRTSARLQQVTHPTGTKRTLQYSLQQTQLYILQCSLQYSLQHEPQGKLQHKLPCKLQHKLQCKLQYKLQCKLQYKLQGAKPVQGPVRPLLH